MRYFEFIAEANGIAARDPGTRFYKSDTDFIDLDHVEYLPQAQPVREYESHNEMMQELDQWSAEFDGEVEIYGAKNSGMKAAMITIWKDSNDLDVAHVKLLRAKSQSGYSGVWTNTDFGKTTGYESRSVTSVSQQTKVKPSDILTSEKPSASTGVIGMLERKLAETDVPADLKTQMITMIKNSVSGDKTPVPGAARYMSLHKQYTAEYAAPIAFLTGSPLLSGDMKQVDTMLADQGTSRAELNSISWPLDSREPLVDSYVYSNNFKLGISSKAKQGGGAGASVAGIFAVINEKRGQMPAEFVTKWADMLDIIDILMNGSAISGMLIAAEKLEIIDADLADEIQNQIGSMDGIIPPMSKQLTKLIAYKGYTPKRTHPNYNVGLHGLAVVARYVEEETSKQGIDDFFKQILRYADMIQIYANVGKSGNDAFFSEFIVKYPPEFDGIITLDPGTYYYATTKPKGKITFKMKK